MIPPLDANGLLPAGVWDCTLTEAAGAFCWNAHRRTLWSGLVAFIEHEYRPLGIAAPLWIDGSFVRAKAQPSDIDLVIDLSDIAPIAQAWRLVLPLRLRHDALKAQYHVDVWPRHPDLPNDIAAFFQYVGDKGGAELDIDPSTPKGILRTRP